MKLLALDFDGTVYFAQEGGYRKQDVEAIRRFQQDGNLVGLNTGRALNFTDRFENLPPVISFDFYICGSGAQLADANEQLWEEKHLDFETVRTLSRTVPDVVQAFVADGTYYCLADHPNPFFSNPVQSIDDLAGKSFAGMSFEPETNEEALKIHQKILGLNLPVISQVNHTSVDVSPLGADKGAGLRAMAKHFNVEPENVFAVGDGDNDLPAILEAAAGFAMKSGSKLLQDHADYSVHSVAEAIGLIEETAAKRRDGPSQQVQESAGSCLPETENSRQ
ncbi:MAG: HAD family phosphatase [Erysipelotrichaceae bacterium]|nr:HAD family phosphatase [Erysipelotrichaceae bacterium]